MQIPRTSGTLALDPGPTSLPVRYSLPRGVLSILVALLSGIAQISLAQLVQPHEHDGRLSPGGKSGG